MNEDQLKVQALLESLGELTQKYENKVGDLRVEITILRQQNEELRELLTQPSGAENGVIEGDIVQEEE